MRGVASAWTAGAGATTFLIVLSIRHDPFPIEAARDLLGLVRAVYAARVAEGADAVTLAKIAVVGIDLACALELGEAHGPGTLGHAAAWKRAERAATTAEDLVAITDGAEQIVRAAMGRVTK